MVFMAEDVYQRELRQVADTLMSAGCQVSIRGDGLGRFVFAQSEGRAVEVSRSAESEVFIELFSAGEEYASTEVMEADFEAATRRALAWLRPK